MKRISVRILLVIIAVTMVLASSACETQKEKLVFADAGWDSIRIHNFIAGTIIENGYGYTYEVMPGTTASTFTGLREGDIDIYMECWTRGIGDDYNEAVEVGDILELSTNFDDNVQGFYVPTYVIEGDEERGIEPMAPDLKTVRDLKKYYEIFEDPEVPQKGRLHGSPPGWTNDMISRTKLENYGLDEYFNYFSPGSGTALATSIVTAVKKGEPWVGYYWEPSFITSKYDLTVLQEKNDFNEEDWETYNCEYPAEDITVAVNKEMENKAPDVIDFLKNYKTSSDLTGDMLVYQRENEAEPKDAAIWFLKEHEDIWTEWVSDDVAEKVKDAL